MYYTMNVEFHSLQKSFRLLWRIKIYGGNEEMAKISKDMIIGDLIALD